MLINILNSKLYARTESFLSQFADDTNMGRTANMMQDRSRIQESNHLEIWARSNKIKYNADECSLSPSDPCGGKQEGFWASN